MSNAEKDRRVMTVLRDPTPDLIAGIAGVAFAKGNYEPYLFTVLTEEGEFEGTICQFNYESYYIVRSPVDWVVYGTAIPATAFKLIRRPRGNSVIEIVRFTVEEDSDDDFDWREVEWTI